MSPSAGSGAGAEEQSPLERAIDLLVYAPLGLVFTAREELPKLIARGRSGATGQVGMARAVGHFAVHQGQREAGKLLRQATERLAGVALAADNRKSQSPTHSSAGTPGRGPSTPALGSASGANAGRSTAVASGPKPGPAEPAAASLAIPGYDSLSAPQVVQRLDGLSGAELEAVGAYESATRGRKTILSRVGQLQSGR